MLAAREISARELCDAAIARIEALDPKINAVVVRDSSASCRRRSRRGARPGERRPLLGIPMTVKEKFNITVWPIKASDRGRAATSP
ncbi:MAG TPA: amidase family protein [Stellaceae bacterium]|jgi:amidase|nr:amidase family protein [Stellaceae bacterium]